MLFTADLHIHSRFSRATSKRLTARSLAAWAMIKGVHVLGTGDFTHPAWRAELREMLMRDEHTGLYRLREPASLEDALPDGMRLDAPEPLFLLQTEISSIYKRHGKVRKVHNLVFMPDMDAAERFSQRLAGIGNLASDGRPILGLDSRDLLEAALECSERAVLIPAHIWTPWFSVFGSRSGFDSLEECFDDLTPHIFALETGLSSDPAMNRLWSRLDGYTLISNSDAHSGENLAREVNCLRGTPGYDAIFAAMRANARGEHPANADCVWAGTAEFFPEEGKYHLDGHRDCHVVLDPRTERTPGDLCPVCGRPLTVGVLHRVLDLADRTTPRTAREMGEPDSASLIPLPEILGELCGAAARSRKVASLHRRALEALGPEMSILLHADVADIRQYWEPLGEAVARMRAGRVIRQGGFDGQFGTVRVFTPQEAAEFTVTGRGTRALLLPMPTPRQRTSALPVSAANRQDSLPAAACPDAAAAPLQSSQERQAAVPPTSPADTGTVLPAPQAGDCSDAPGTSLPLELGGVIYSPAQARAIVAGPEPVLVLAGPGAGKTRVLVGRALRLLAQGCPADALLAVTFTCRAAQEMQRRLRDARGAAGGLPCCDTLHALALRALAPAGGQPPLVLDEQAAAALFAQADAQAGALALAAPDTKRGTAARLRWDALQLARETLAPLPDDLADSARRYAERKRALGVLDYTDLLEQWLRLAEEEHAAGRPLRWRHLLVDEVQDLSPLQLRLLTMLLPPDGTGFFGIGDPDQSIYAFRGAQPDVPGQLGAHWPRLRELHLRESYRAAPCILACAHAALEREAHGGRLSSRRTDRGVACAFSAPSGAEESRWIARQISGLLGRTSHTLLDEDRHEAAATARRARRADTAAQEAALAAMQGTLAPGDIAVLTRLRAQIPLMGRALDEYGIPWSAVRESPCWQDARVARVVQEAARALGLDAEAAELAAHGMPELPPLSLPRTPVDWKRGPAALPEAMPGAFDPFFATSPAWRALDAAWRDCGQDWRALLALLRRQQEDDLLRDASQHVRLLTLHASKGLEFRAVFLPALEDGLLPLRRELLFPPDEESGAPAAQEAAAAPVATGEDHAEERRLLYVGITRAADAVFLSHAAARRLYHKEYALAPSPFLKPVLPLCRTTALHARSMKQARQLSLLQV